MPFKEGQSGNPAGRPKGAVDKKHSEVKAIIKAQIEGDLNRISEYLGELSARDKLSALVQLLPYVASKMKPTEDGDNEGQMPAVDLSHLTFEQIYQIKWGKKPE